MVIWGNVKIDHIEKDISQRRTSCLWAMSDGRRAPPRPAFAELVLKTGRAGERERKVLETWVMSCKARIKDATAAQIFDLCRTHAVEWQGTVEIDARSLDFSGRMITVAFERVKELPGAPSVSSAYDDRLQKGKRLYSVPICDLKNGRTVEIIKK